MHRSGTSAVMGAASLLGVELGEPLMSPDPEHNPRGFFEHAEVTAFHERLLWGAGRTWDDPRPFPTAWLAGEEAAPFRHQLEELVERTYGGLSLWGVKDPRICRLVPLWLGACDHLGAEPSFLIVHRHPASVAASLRRRDGFTAEKATRLWTDHYVATERDTRGRRRTVVSYDRLLEDPVGELTAVEAALGVSFPRPPEETAEALRSFLSPDLRHHRHDRQPRQDGRHPGGGDGKAFESSLPEDLAAAAGAIRKVLTAGERSGAGSGDPLEAMASVAERHRSSMAPADAVAYEHAQVTAYRLARDLVERLAERIEERLAVVEGLEDRLAMLEERIPGGPADLEGLRNDLTARIEALGAELERLEERLESVLGSGPWRLYSKLRRRER